MKKQWQIPQWLGTTLAVGWTELRPTRRSLSKECVQAMEPTKSYGRPDATLGLRPLPHASLCSLARVAPPQAAQRRRSASHRGWVGILCIATLLLLSPGCSVRRLAVNKLGDALSAGGTTFSSDNDPDLVRDAAPFSLKIMEALLAESPRHVELRRAAASGFAQYAFAFVQMEADEKEQSDFSASEALRLRARRLYVRGRNHALQGLEVRHPKFEKTLRSDPAAAVSQLTPRDLPLIYWAGAAWAGAISQSKDQPELIAELPLVGALMDRALQLDPSWGKGSLHSFFIAYEPMRPGASADRPERSKAHLERAIALNGATLAGPFVMYAEAICVPRKDKAEFEALLRKALQIDIELRPESRLENLIMQRRARWLQSRIDELFVTPHTAAP